VGRTRRGVAAAGLRAPRRGPGGRGTREGRRGGAAFAGGGRPANGDAAQGDRATVNIQSLPLLRTGLAVRPSLRLALDVALAAGPLWATSAAFPTAGGHPQQADSASRPTVA